MALKRYIGVAAAVSAIGLGACGGSEDLLLIPVPDESLESTLADFSGGGLSDPSAFDVISGDAVRTDLFPGWDFLFEVRPDGNPVLWPRSAIAEEDSDAGLQLVGQTFDGLTSAPEDGYVLLEPVAIDSGDVLAVRSRRDPAFGSVRCRRFGKLEVMALEEAEGTMTFRFLVNPNCEKRTLVPGAEE